MVGIGVDEEFSDDLAAKASLGEHAPNGAFHHLDGELFEHDAGRTGAEASFVAGNVVVVLLVLKQRIPVFLLAFNSSLNGIFFLFEVTKENRLSFNCDLCSPSFSPRFPINA